MSISISWTLKKPSEANRVAGTSSDWQTFNATFPKHLLSQTDRKMLMSMHLASGFPRSLWGDLVDVLDSLPEGSIIEVSAEY